MAGTLCTTEHQDVAELGPISGFPERRPVARQSGPSTTGLPARLATTAMDSPHHGMPSSLSTLVRPVSFAQATRQSKGYNVGGLCRIPDHREDPLYLQHFRAGNPPLGCAPQGHKRFRFRLGRPNPCWIPLGHRHRALLGPVRPASNPRPRRWQIRSRLLRSL